MRERLLWLFTSEEGLAWRIAGGVAVFAALAVWDVCRNGRAARRWKEYVFLLTAVATACAYGIVNDQLTVRISWEYYVYGKELMQYLAPDGAVNHAGLRAEAVGVGAAATWWCGLLFGAAILLVNNPRPHRPAVSFARLYAMLPVVLAAAAVLAAVGGVLGWSGRLAWAFPEGVPDEWRPHRLMCVWGMHLGGYLGGVLGTVLACGHVLHRRATMRRRQTVDSGPPAG